MAKEIQLVDSRELSRKAIKTCFLCKTYLFMMSVRIVLTSTDSSEYFDNKPNCFRVQLNKQIQFDGYWTVALREFSSESWIASKKKSELFVCCDICEETLIGGKEAPLLRRVYLGGKAENITYTLPYYIPVKIGQLQQIGIYITDRDGNLVSFLNGPVTVTLHFKKFPYVL